MTELDEAVLEVPQGDTWDDVAFDVAALPLDEPPLAEGDDSLIPFLQAAGPDLVKEAHAFVRDMNVRRGIVEQGAPLRPKTAFIPMGRSPLKLRMKGLDVFALKRALHAAGLKGFNRRNAVFGAGLKAAVEHFQRLEGLRRTGVYDLATHKRLARWYDAYGAFLLGHNVTPGPPPKPKPTPIAVMRKRIVGIAFFAYHHGGSLGYLQYRPMTRMGPPPNIPNPSDCSQWDTWVYESAGAPDPNARHYDGSGYTGTIAATGKRVSQPGLADHSLYGPAPGYKHVTVCIGAGRCLSHGSPGVHLLEVKYRDDFAEYVSTLKR